MSGNEIHEEKANGTENGVGFGTRPVFTPRLLHVFSKVINYIILNFFSKVGILLSMLQGYYESSISTDIED